MIRTRRDPLWPPRSRRSTSPAGTTCPTPTLPWERVAELAEKQGIGEADVVWDLTAGMPPAPPRRRGGRKTALVKRAKPPA